MLFKCVCQVDTGMYVWTYENQLVNVCKKLIGVPKTWSTYHFLSASAVSVRIAEFQSDI